MLTNLEKKIKSREGDQDHDCKPRNHAPGTNPDSHLRCGACRGVLRKSAQPEAVVQSPARSGVLRLRRSPPDARPPGEEGVRPCQLDSLLRRARLAGRAQPNERAGRPLRGRAAHDCAHARSRAVDDVLPRHGREFAGADERSEKVTPRRPDDGFRLPLAGFRKPHVDGAKTGSREPEAGRPALLSSLVRSHSAVMSIPVVPHMQDEEEDDEIPVISGRGEGIMDEVPATGSGHARRNEDIALDLMKFIAMTTGYGRTSSGGGVGFTGGGAAAKPEDYAAHLLELYGKCLGAVAGKK